MRRWLIAAVLAGCSGQGVPFEPVLHDLSHFVPPEDMARVCVPGGERGRVLCPPGAAGAPGNGVRDCAPGECATCPFGPYQVLSCVTAPPDGGDCVVLFCDGAEDCAPGEHCVQVGARALCRQDPGSDLPTLCHDTCECPVNLPDCVDGLCVNPLA